VLPNQKKNGFFASRAFPPVRLEIVGPEGARLHVQILQRGAESTPASVASVTEGARLATFARFLALGAHLPLSLLARALTLQLLSAHAHAIADPKRRSLVGFNALASAGGKWRA